MIRYATILVAALLASPTLAQCPGGVCRGPVRSILTVPRKLARPLVTTTVAAATCGHRGCKCDACPGARCNCDLQPIPQATKSPQLWRATRVVKWSRTPLLHRLRFVPQRRR